MIYVVGVVVACFLSVILLTKKHNTWADRVLAGWLAAIGCHLLLFYLHSIRHNYDFPFSIGIELPMPLMHGPFLYCYTVLLARPIGLKPARLVLHFVPVAIVYLYLIPFYTLSDAQKIFVFEHQGIGYETTMKVMIWLINISGVGYIGATYWALRRHKRRISNLFSAEEKVSLDWLRYLIYGLALIWAVVLFANSDPLIYVSVVGFVLFVGYYGIKQVGIFTDNRPLPSENQAEIAAQQTEEPSRKYEKSSLSEDAAAAMHAVLKEVMHEERLFTNPDLSLTDLADHLNVHPNHLSQVINTFEGKNFFDYVNSLRVEAFKWLVEQPDSQRYTLLGLAYDCGFNSKTSFNRNFKKITGLSPSVYVAQERVQLVK
jgi:AraC-like DNA-binding protein